MIAGVGVDAVDLDRFARTLARTPTLRERLFAPAELRLRPPLRDEQLAARFAVKEALIKTLGGGVPGFRFRDVATLPGPHGAPRLELAGAVSDHVHARGLRLHVSLTHDRPVAVAVVIAEKADAPA